MPGLDELIAGLGGGGLALALAVALLLGLRHATDPDHLTAVATLIVSDAGDGARRARRLALAWGAGHGTTLLACGLPVVLYGDALPESARSAAELGIGAIIALLAARLLLRWRRGVLHTHPHDHGGVRHAHPHAHEQEHERAHAHVHEHRHEHAEALGRSPLAAFGIGLVHGVGGSAGAGILLVGAASGTVDGVLALALFAGGTALSMVLVSSGFAWLLARGDRPARLEGAVPVFGAAGLLFGAWYALAALDAVAYPF